jgi:hypothetical protein
MPGIPALPALLEEPRFEVLGVRILAHDGLQELPLQRDPQGVRCRVALPALPSSIRGLEGAEQLAADGRRPQPG